MYTSIFLFSKSDTINVKQIITFILWCIYITWIRAYIMYVLDRDKMNDMKYVIVDLNGMVWYTNFTVMVTFKF